MGMWIGRNRKARVTYGFDEIALVPGRVTRNPNEVDIAFRLPRKDTEALELKIPILASAMDGVVDVRFAVAMSKLGGLAVLNLEGVQTRYKNPQEVLQKIVETDKGEITTLLQKIYQEPVQEDLIAARIRQIKDGGALAAVSCIPQRAAAFG
jgi:IMP dehydrogenase